MIIFGWELFILNQWSLSQSRLPVSANSIYKITYMFWLSSLGGECLVGYNLKTKPYWEEEYKVNGNYRDFSFFS